MLSRNTETLIVFTCLAVLSVLTWYVARDIAHYASGDAPEAKVAINVPLTPPPAVVIPQDRGEGTTDPAVSSTTPPDGAVAAAQPQSRVERLRARAGLAAPSFAEPNEGTAMNSFLWSVYPYICIVLFFAVPIIRMLTRPFSWSTRASGLFGHRMLGIASTIFHWGLVLVLIGHLLGLFGGLLGSPGAITGFYWLALIGGFLVLVGSIMALARRISTPEVRAMSQSDDYVVHVFIIAIVGLALYQVVVDRIFGVAYTASSWAASLWTLSPQPELMASSSLISKLHVFVALTFFGYFPFTKLVHFWTFPINYFVRPHLSMRTQRYRFQRRWEFAWRSDKSWLTYGLIAVATIFVFSAMLLDSATPPASAEFVLASVEQKMETGPRLSGYPLYVSQCARCHGVGGRGDGPGADSPTFRVPPRDLVAARYRFISTNNGIASDDDLYRTMFRGLDVSGMPAFPDLTDAQLITLVDVLNDFRADGPGPGHAIAIPTPPASTSQSIARGRELYMGSCANCHGEDGSGGLVDCFDWMTRQVIPTDLSVGQVKLGTSAEELFRVITVGVPGGASGTNLMLSFANVPEADRWAIVHFIRAEILPASVIEE